MLAQRCFSVVTLKQLSIKVEFQPPEFAGYFNTHIYKYRVHYVTSCKIHLKIRKQLMKTAPWKKLFLNCVNINIITYDFTHFFSVFQFYTPLETIKDLRFSNVYMGYKRGRLGWNELKNLTCFFPMFPFYTPWKYQKTMGYFHAFRGYTSWKIVKQSLP